MSNDASSICETGGGGNPKWECHLLFWAFLPPAYLARPQDGVPPWPGQDGNPLSGLDGVPLPIQDLMGYPPCPELDGTWTGYASCGTPLAVSSRKTFLFTKIVWNWKKWDRGEQAKDCNDSEEGYLDRAHGWLSLLWRVTRGNRTRGRRAVWREMSPASPGPPLPPPHLK